MAESSVFSLASKILSTIASPAFEKAYEKGVSIWEAKDELAKLKVTTETIQAVLLDAEKKQESSAAVKNWIKRLKGVLYDADDLFDEVATDDLLKQLMKEGNYKLSLKKKVRVSCVNLNPIVSRNSIAKKVKAIRKSLLEISSDMAGLGFVPCGKEEEVLTGLRRRQDPGCFVKAKYVIGRDKDKKAIIEMLFNESCDAKPDVPIIVIAIVGIGGMGKTTLAQLVYNDDEVKEKFKNNEVKEKFKNRWFARISDISDEKEVMGKIFQSICEKSYSDFTLDQLETKIRESIEGKKFLLVLDDVWDDDRANWLGRINLLSSGARGSRIIVTTRSSSVAAGVGALRTHPLGGLSEDDSWNLFRRVAFAPGNENDARRIDLGREIVKKCRNVPLAIRSIGSLLFEKNTIQEWESIKGEELPKLGTHHKDGIMPVLKLSYDHLPSTLKQCFAYCSLFPKDYNFNKVELIYLWIAQGYVKENNEDVGHSHFMYLLRRGFFQEAKEHVYGEIRSCKMHDLIHDLAQHVAGEESILLTESSNASDCAKHVTSGDFKIDDSWAIPVPMLNVNGLRSFMLLNGSICNPSLLDQVFVTFNRLRALLLVGLEMENVPSSIGELKHLKYLDLSQNKFESLPNSLTNLLNLLVLDITSCMRLQALPEDLRKLINLRCLIIGCDSLMHMPGGIGEMSCLQYLQIDDCKKLKYLPPLSSLPNLRELTLRGLVELEYVEEEDNEPIHDNASSSIFFPRLEKLKLGEFPKLKRWRRRVASTPPQFPLLSYLWLDDCPELELKSFPLCPRLRQLVLDRVDDNEVMREQWPSTIFGCSSSVSLSFPASSFPPAIEDIRIWRCEWLGSFHDGGLAASLRHLVISECSSLKSVHLESPHLQTIHISDCDELMSFKLHVEAPTTSLLSLEIDNNEQLKKLYISAAHLNALEYLRIVSCPKLWDSLDKSREYLLDWDSFTNLRELKLDPLHPLGKNWKIPNCLRQRHALGQLNITDENWNPIPFDSDGENL